jgi:trimeric autotransporter adhesin
VAGGFQNTASGVYSNVSGGYANVASGIYSSIPGGVNNTAQGTGSLAAGQDAQAIYDGSFVWGDDTVPQQVASTAPNQFVVRASGGLWFGSTSTVSFPTGSFIATDTGAYLSTGGTWTNASDRNLKQNFSAVNQRSVLRRVAALPLFTWNYKAQPSSVRHLGPMAQDFHAAFGLGEDEKHISTVDAEGVAFAAIQELYKELKFLEARSEKAETSGRQKDAIIAQQAGQIRQLTADVEKLESLEGRMAALQARLERLAAGTQTHEARNREH